MNQEKQLHQKLKTENYWKENKLTLNADKTELLYFSTSDELEPRVIFTGNSMIFEAHLNVVLKKWRPPFAHYIW